MRATWTAAALTATLSITGVTVASADVVGAAKAAHTTIRPISAKAPEVGLPAVPDPAKNLDVLGALGGVLKLVTGLVAGATPPSGTPDPAALQKQVADLQAAVKDLLGKLPAPPALPAAPLGTDSRSLVPGDLPVPVPVPLNPADALAKVQKDVGDLVASATAAKPDPAAVQKLIPPLSVDTVGATVATATSLTGV